MIAGMSVVRDAYGIKGTEQYSGVLSRIQRKQEETKDIQRRDAIKKNKEYFRKSEKNNCSYIQDER